MSRPRGWGYAQLRSNFLGDSEFLSLRMAIRSHGQFAAAVGVWAMALAQAWRDDNDDVSGLMALWPRESERLEAAGLIRDGHLVGYDKWTEAARRKRAYDSEYVVTTRNESFPYKAKAEGEVEGEVEGEGAAARVDYQWLRVHGIPLTPRRRQTLDLALQHHDKTGPEWAVAVMEDNPDDPIGAVIKADREWCDLQRKGADAAEAESRERAAEGGKARYGLSGVNAELAQLLREREGVTA